ncbi:hypothetical protein [Nostoc mirabile]|uniref:hypothetical protein n=1 Tax=Nostoc mirabile TaxID=2907820 RepID=UPI001E30163B|nr:hypothetical protein [Nostoc mirabile]
MEVAMRSQLFGEQLYTSISISFSQVRINLYGLVVIRDVYDGLRLRITREF